MTALAWPWVAWRGWPWLSCAEVVCIVSLQPWLAKVSDLHQTILAKHDILVRQVPVDYGRSVGVEETEITRYFETGHVLLRRTQVVSLALKILSKILPHPLHNEHGFVRRLIVERPLKIHYVGVIHLFEQLAFSLEIHHHLLKVALSSSRLQKQAMYPLHSDRSAVQFSAVHWSIRPTTDLFPDLEGGRLGTEILGRFDDNLTGEDAVLLRSTGTHYGGFSGLCRKSCMLPTDSSILQRKYYLQHV